MTMPLAQNLIWSPDNTYDIGAAGNRPRRLYLADGIQTPNVAIDLFGSGVVSSIGLSAYAWSSQSTMTLTPTGNVVEQRNGTTAQTLRIYNTYTDASNYERLALYHSGGTASIDTQQAGTGASRVLQFQTTGTANIQFNTNSANRWYIHGGFGTLFTNNHNTTDIGDPFTQPRNIYVAGALRTGGKAGAAVDGDVANPTDGMLRFDSTNNRLYCRVGAVWRYAALT